MHPIAINQLSASCLWTALIFFPVHVYISCLKLVVQITFLLHKYAPFESCRNNKSSNKHDKYKMLTNLIRVLLLTCFILFYVT